MSFEVFVQCFQNGESASIPRERIREAFGSNLTEPELDSWHLHYDDSNSCDLDLTSHGSDPEMVRGFTVHRPCGDSRLWDALASILALGDMALYFPGCHGPVVARKSVVQHLPRSLVEALGQPLVVTSGKEIENEIQAA